MTTSTVPTGTTLPSSTRMRVTVPAAGDGISTVVLSVWISTSGSSSPISWPSETSQRAISPSVNPSPRSGSLNSYATRGFLPDRAVAENRVDAFRLVDQLRHCEVDRDARECERVLAVGRELALDQVEHRLDGELGGNVEIGVESKGEPCVRGPRHRHAEVEVVADVDRDLRRVERTLDRRARVLAVALRGVSIAGRQERTVIRNRQEERRPRDEQLAVDVAAAATRRDRRPHARLVRRHADDAEERGDGHGPAAVVRRSPAFDVHLPLEHVSLAEGDAPRASPALA